MNEFDSISIGKVVLISRRDSESLSKVEKVTPNYFVAGNVKFRKKDGCQAGSDSWNWVSASIPSEEDLERVRNNRQTRQLRIKLSEFISSASLDQLLAINAAISQSQPKEV